MAGFIVEDFMTAKNHPVQPAWKKNALIDNDTYLEWYRDSIADPDSFWGKHGKRIDWFEPYTRVRNASFDGEVSIKWFEDGVTNVSYNCIDRHLEELWEEYLPGRAG